MFGGRIEHEEEHQVTSTLYTAVYRVSTHIQYTFFLSCSVTVQHSLTVSTSHLLALGRNEFLELLELRGLVQPLLTHGLIVMSMHSRLSSIIV